MSSLFLCTLKKTQGQIVIIGFRFRYDILLCLTNETLVRYEVLIPITNLFVFAFVFVFVLANEQAMRSKI